MLYKIYDKQLLRLTKNTSKARLTLARYIKPWKHLFKLPIAMLIPTNNSNRLWENHWLKPGQTCSGKLSIATLKWTILNARRRLEKIRVLIKHIIHLLHMRTKRHFLFQQRNNATALPTRTQKRLIRILSKIKIWYLIIV